MKILQFISLALLLFACRGEDLESIQKIDQVLHIYIKDAQGNDLLNPERAEAFQSVEFKDMQAEYDRVAVSVSKKQDSAKVFYYEYITGANRLPLPNATDQRKTYQSTLAVQYRLSATSDIEEDIMSLSYEWTPQIFQLKSVTYNDKVIFEKTAEGISTITIQK